jgi:hypothetical protein
LALTALWWSTSHLTCGAVFSFICRELLAVLLWVQPCRGISSLDLWPSFGGASSSTGTVAFIAAYAELHQACQYRIPVSPRWPLSRLVVIPYIRRQSAGRVALYRPFSAHYERFLTIPLIWWVEAESHGELAGWKRKSRAFRYTIQAPMPPAALWPSAHRKTTRRDYPRMVKAPVNYVGFFFEPRERGIQDYSTLSKR